MKKGWFMKYPKIYRLGHKETEGIFADYNDEIVIEEKVDGCLHNRMLIVTEKGPMEIGRIVRNRENVRVLAYDPKSGDFAFKRILEYHEYPNKQGWVRIRIASYRGPRRLIVTPNHRILTDEGWLRADEICAGDKILSFQEGTPLFLRQMLLGMILGDGSLCKTGFKVAKVVEHKDVIDLLLRVFKKANPRVWTTTSGYGSLIYNFRLNKGNILIRELSKEVLNEEEKFEFREDWFRKITPVALAWWYVDDGHLTSGNSGQAAFHTERYSLDDIKIMQRVLKEKFGLDSFIRDVSKNGKEFYILVLDVESTKMLHLWIAPYVPKSMKYKLRPEYRNIPSVYDGLGDLVGWDVRGREVLSVENPFWPTNYSTRMYDLTVEDYHTYIIGNLHEGYILHNSNFRVGYDGEDFRFGSRNVELTKESGYGRFEQAVEYVKKLKDKVKEGYIYYGEYMVPHTIQYDWDKVPILLGFDIYDTDRRIFLDYDKKKKEFERLGIPMVPLVARVKVSEITEDFLERVIPQSKYYSGLAEGVVFKNYNKQIFAKLVAEQFRERNRDVFGRTKREFQNDDTLKFVEMYWPPRRIEKVIQSLVDSGEPLGMELMRILPKKVIEDAVEEEGYEMFFNNLTVDFKRMRKLISRRCVNVLKRELASNYLKMVRKL